MTDYEREKVKDLISALEPEEKKIALDILLLDRYGEKGRGLSNDRATGTLYFGK